MLSENTALMDIFTGEGGGGAGNDGYYLIVFKFDYRERG